MAPPKKPDFLKLLEGNPGKRRLRGGDRVVIAEPAVKPAFVTGYAADVWDEITAAAPEVYRATDSHLLAAFCLACDQHREATMYLNIEGHVIYPPRGKAFRNPWGQIASAAAADIEKLGTRLGLNPIARQNLQAQPAKPASKFAGLTGRSEEHTSELQSLMRNSYAVFCLKTKTHT